MNINQHIYIERSRPIAQTCKSIRSNKLHNFQIKTLINLFAKCAFFVPLVLGVYLLAYTLSQLQELQIEEHYMMLTIWNYLKEITITHCASLIDRDIIWVLVRWVQLLW